MLAGPLAAQTALPPPAKSKIDFIRDVEPILAQKCHSCHSDGVPQAGLNVKRRQNAMRGGDYGPVILPGNSANSKLIKRLVTGDGGMQMPPPAHSPTKKSAFCAPGSIKAPTGAWKCLNLDRRRQDNRAW